MRRLPLTVSLTALTALALTTAAIAAPTGAGGDDCPMADGPGMAAMHADPEAKVAMHEQMMASQPEVAAHLEDTGIDAAQLRDWLAAGLDHDEMHERMRRAGVDLEAMHAACPRGDHAPHGGSMPHGDHEGHHR